MTTDAENAATAGRRIQVLSFGVDRLNLAECVHEIVTWARRRMSKIVCAANVHMVMEAFDDMRFSAIVRSADLVVTDGMPLVWLLRRRGVRGKQRVAGIDLMLRLCSEAQIENLPIALFGGSVGTLDRLKAVLHQTHPTLNIACAISPPVGTADALSADALIAPIVASGASIVFVGLGCPKQEVWAAKCRGRIDAVMLGVGAAFEFIANPSLRAPRWMQRFGLEWMYRLLHDPPRLWRRYLIQNPRFIFFITATALGIELRRLKLR